MSDTGVGAILWTFFTFTIIGLGGALMWGCPQYNVWQQGLSGEAELKRAEWNRQVVVKEAQAKLEAAKSLAMAEVERSRGVAEANKIIGESLKGNEGYLRYLWINGIAEKEHPTIIYVPTEANLPIMEAGRQATK